MEQNGRFMIIAVFSLGQFISSKLDVLKSGFQKWFSNQGKEASGETVWKWMEENLAPLRIAAISLEEFCDQFNKHFEVKMSFADFNEIFNSMCLLDSDSLKRVAHFKEFLGEQEHIKFVLVSHTNASHLKFIMKQLNEILPNCQANIISDENKIADNAQILFAPSMASKCTDHPGTLKYALPKIPCDSELKIISFLNTIKEFDHPDFSYVDPGKNLEHVIESLESFRPVPSFFK